MVKEAEKYLQLMDRQYYKSYGKVVKVVGLTIESVGPKARMGDLCKIYPNEMEEEYVIAEVVGFQDSRLILMPVDSVEGVGTGCIVENTGHPLSVLVGEELLGHTLDGIGRMTDGTEEIHGSYYPLENTPPDPMDRRIISEVLPLGVSGGRTDYGWKRTAYRCVCRFRCREKYPAWHVCKKYEGRHQCNRTDR